jgi:hypothetical protein
MTLACSGGELDSGPLVMLNRQIQPLALELQWRRGGPVEDSVLYTPWDVQANERHAVVLDQGGYRVRAFDVESGEVAWSVGRKGGGPMEFEAPSDLFANGDGWSVWDWQLGRLTHLDENGRLLSERIVQSALAPGRFCALPDGRAAVLLESDSAAAAILEADGTLSDVQDLPWPGFSDLVSLQRNTKWATDGRGKCIAYVTMSTGFAVFEDGSFGPGHSYAEPIELPRVEINETRGRRSIRLVDIQTAAGDAFVHGNELWLLFYGRTDDARRLIDVHDAASGAYLRSYRLPFGNASQVSRVEDRLFVTRTVEGYPVLEAYRILEGESSEGSLTR